MARDEPTPRQKQFALWLVSFSHLLTHVQFSVTSVLFPVMMRDLGFGYLELGVLTAVSSLTMSLQIIYGFLARFMKQAVILASGSLILGASAAVQAVIGNYPQLVAARALSGIASSPQHPMGSSLLSGFYSKGRAWALTLHVTAGNVGTFVGPAIAAFLLLYMGWRPVFLILAVPSLLTAFAYFWIPNVATAGDRPESRSGKAGGTLSVYFRCLKNRNVLLTSLAAMVGAAGRGSGFNITYLVPFFMERFGVTASAGGLLFMLLQGAGVVGPLLIAWLSDRVGYRILILQATLLVSAITTYWLPYHGAVGALLLLNLVLYGAFINAQGSLTQAIIGDFATRELADVAFSIFYFLGSISSPVWTLLIGYIVDHYGFTPAFYVAGSTYFAGMMLMLFVREETTVSPGPRPQ